MKGVKYNLTFINKKGEETLFEGLAMKQVIETLFNQFLDEYGYPPKLSKHIVYNLQNKRNCRYTLLSHACKIIKV